MASYLEGYGETQARRSRKLRWLILTPILALILCLVLYFQFRDWPQTRRAKRFLELVQQKDYKAAYTFWGCTAEKPCPQYALDKFMEDWGPGGPLKNPEAARIAGHKGCKGGVINIVRSPGAEDILLWVDRATGEIGFAPWRLKEIPEGFRPRMAAWMWDITRNCDPLIGP